MDSSDNFVWLVKHRQTIDAEMGEENLVSW